MTAAQLAAAEVASNFHRVSQGFGFVVFFAVLIAQRRLVLSGEAERLPFIHILGATLSGAAFPETLLPAYWGIVHDGKFVDLPENFLDLLTYTAPFVSFLLLLAAFSAALKPPK